ncbi:unnamed protein product [Closterium sp. NIES-54]
MASLSVLAFDHEGRPIQFETWLDNLQLYLLSDSRDSVSLFDHTTGAAPTPPATADSATRSQWLTRDAAAQLAIRNHLPLDECAHFGQHRTAQALYDAVVARYSLPATPIPRAVLRVLRHNCHPGLILSPRRSCASGLLSAPAFGVELPALETLQLETLELEVLEFLLELVVLGALELVDFAVACRLDYTIALVVESESATPPSVGGECALGTDVLEDRQEDFECLATAVPRFASMLLAPEGDPDAPDIPPSCSYAEAITVDGMWIIRVKRPPGSPPVFKARYVARGFSQRQGVDYFQTFSPTPKMTTLRVLLHVAAQRDYALHSLDFSTAFLQGSLHEEIWLRRPPSFTGSFPAGTKWSLPRPVYGLSQAPREWHDTLRTTLAAPGFTPSTVDPSLFLCTETSLPQFYVLVYVDDLVFATADTEALTLVNSKLQKRHTCTDLGEQHSYLGLQITRDRARRTITLTQSHMVHQVLQHFGFHNPLLCLPVTRSHLRTSPYSRVRVQRYLCSTSGMGLVLGGRGPVVLTGHADASWVDDSATQRSSHGYTFSLDSCSVSWRSTRSSSVLSSSCEAEIYAGTMAAQELRWLTYLLTDLGEQPRSPPVLYVDNKAMISLCQEHRLEHRTKHIALQYFLARELQQRGQLRLAYAATRANTADIFTKALPPGDHQRFSTVLGLVPTLPHLLTT